MSARHVLHLLAAAGLVFALPTLSACTIETSASTSNPFSGIKTYDSPTNQFSLAYPSSWQAPDSPPDGFVFAAVGMADETLLVSKKDVPGLSARTLEEALAAMKADYGADLVEGSVTSVNGRDAARVVANATVGGKPMTAIQYMWVSGDTRWILTLRTLQADFAAKKSTLEQIANSFAVKVTTKTAAKAN